MTVSIHGEPAGRTVGPPKVGRMEHGRDDPVQVAKQTRALLLSGRWRRSTKTGSDDQRADFLLQVAVPAALELFPPAARHALIRQPGPRQCTWCNYRGLARMDRQPTPTPTDPLLTLLGQPCRTCDGAFQRAAAVDRARARGPLVASADALQRRGMNSQDPQLDQILWRHRHLTAGGRARASLTRRTATPGYWRPRPWPRVRAGGRR